MARNYSLHYLRNRPNGRWAWHDCQSVRALSGPHFCAFCVANHYLGSGAVNHMSEMRAAARALNKPLLIIGVDRKLAGLAFILSVIIGANGSKIIASILF